MNIITTIIEYFTKSEEERTREMLDSLYIENLGGIMPTLQGKSDD